MEKEVIDELQSLRAVLRNAEAELQRVRDEGESRRDLVDILHEVMGDLFRAADVALYRAKGNGRNLVCC